MSTLDQRQLSTRPWRVIITRPQASAQALAAQLQAADFAVSQAPLLEICPLQDLAQMRDIQNKIMDLDHYDAVFFVSINAVHEAFRWIDTYWPQLPVGIRYYAVGESTAKVLESYGASVSARECIEKGEMTSEALLQHSSLQSLTQQRFLIARGLGGRNHMAEQLRERGALVDIVELYKRALPESASRDWRALLDTELQSNTHYTVITLHSGETLGFWRGLIAQLASAHQPEATLLALPVLVPSLRLAEQAQALGFTQIMTAENATDVAVVKALCEARGTQLLS